MLKLEQASKTLRKLPIFGYADRNDFEWPKAQDVLGWQTYKPIKVVSFTYRTKVNFIHSIQVTLSNGQVSPMIEGPSKEDLSDFKTLQIGDASLIKRV